MANAMSLSNTPSSSANPTFDTGQVLEKVREHRAQIS
jgi:hypothetical protein